MEMARILDLFESLQVPDNYTLHKNIFTISNKDNFMMYSDEQTSQIIHYHDQ